MNMGKWMGIGIVAGIAVGIFGLVELLSRGVEAHGTAVAEGTVQDTGSIYDTRTHKLTLSIQFWKTVPRPAQSKATLNDVLAFTPFQYSIDRGKTWQNATTTKYGNWQATFDIPGVVDEAQFQIAGITAKVPIFVKYM
jgi:hypothetical protein